MKKIIGAIALVAVLAICSAPILGGFITQRAIKGIVNDINGKYSEKGYAIHFKIMKYDRKLFSSQIEWEITSDYLKNIYDIDHILLTQNAKHGLTSIKAYTNLEKNEWFKDIINQKFDGKNPFKIKTEYNYFGDIKETITIDNFIIKDGNEIYNIMPGNVYITFDKKIKNISVKADWKGLSIADKLIINDISFDSKGKKSTEYIWTGDSRLGVRKIYVKNFYDYFDLSDAKLNYSIDFDKTNDVLSFKIESGFGAATFEEEKIKNASVQLEINGIDVQGYNNLIKVYYKRINKAMKYFENGENITDEQAIFVAAQMIQAYEKLLKKGLEIKISDLEAELTEGKIKANTNLALKEDITFAMLFSLMFDPLSAFNIFYLKSDIILPYKFAEYQPELVYPIYPGMQTGFFVKQGDNLVHNAETKDGKLIVNGEEVILE